MELVQPQIVKFNKNQLLPEQVRGKYFIYYVISGLFDESNAIHAIYVNLNSVDKLHGFISDIQKTDITLLFTGDDNFSLGNDYLLNKSLYNSIINSDNFTPEYPVEHPIELAMDLDEDIDVEMGVEQLFYLPDYMTNNGYNTEYFDYVDNYETLFNYFKKKNEYSELTFDEEYLMDFYRNFVMIILELTVYTPTENIDFIYKQVLNYFAEYQTDNVFIGMSLIFNTLYGVAKQTTDCGCNTNPSINAVCTTSCNDYYKNAMVEYIKTMFGDYTFYQKWFFITDELSGLTQPNQIMIDKLRLFITEFLTLDINIGTAELNNNCMCPTVDLTSDKCNRGILNNFLSILDFVETNTIEENSNRIKVYGEEFGKIFPKMIF